MDSSRGTLLRLSDIRFTKAREIGQSIMDLRLRKDHQVRPSSNLSIMFPNNILQIPARQFADSLDIPKAKVFRLKGFEKVEEFEIDRTEIHKQLDRDPQENPSD